MVEPAATKAVERAPEALIAAARKLLRADADKHAADEWRAHAREQDEQDARARQDALLSAAKRADAEAFERRVRELDEAKQHAPRGDSLAQKRLDDLHKRLDDFRGNDDESLRERLLKEGFPEALTQQELRMRTLDQRTGNELGMRARFFEQETKNASQPPMKTSAEPLYLRESEPEPTYQANTPQTSSDPKAKDAADGVKDALGLRPLYK